MARIEKKGIAAALRGAPADRAPGAGVEWRVANALEHAYGALQRAGCDTPVLDADLLLAHSLGWDRSRLLAYPEMRLTDGQWQQFETELRRREAREPLAYILGNREFYDLGFFVDHRVLVPRPETELMVELVLGWTQPRLEAAAAKPDSHTGVISPERALTLVDVGTGSGCVAVTLAVHLPDARIWAVDASASALEVAAINSRRHGVQASMRLLQGDLLEPVPEPVDAIVANLPYVRSSELESLQPEIRAYEPWSALDGGPDGLDILHRLLDQAPQRLRRGGALWLEIGADQGCSAAALARAAFPAAAIAVRQDYGGRDRILSVETMSDR